MDILEQLPGYIGWKDSDFRHLGCNANLSSILSLQDPSKIHDLLPSHYKMEVFSNPCQLSTRELESLFCLLHGMSAKQISECLGLSKRTIEAYIENIKNKFGCQNKTKLLIESINAGYANHIPQRFLHTK